MTWQILIWNVFVWTFTGLMIYITNSSLWWLILPAMFTGTQNAVDMLKASNDDHDLEQFQTDEDTKRKIAALLDQAKRGKL